MSDELLGLAREGERMRKLVSDPRRDAGNDLLIVAQRKRDAVSGDPARERGGDGKGEDNPDEEVSGSRSGQSSL